MDEVLAVINQLTLVVPDKQQKVELYIMNGMIVLRLLSDPKYISILQCIAIFHFMLKPNFPKGYFGT